MSNLCEYRKPEFTWHGGEFPIDMKELYGWLQPSRNFSTWRSYFMAQFEAGQDFRTEVVKNPIGRPSTEVYISMRMAKHVAMRSSTRAGYVLRDYFIDRDEALTQIEQGQAPAFPDPASMTKLDWIQVAYESEQRAVALEAENRALMPKADAYLRWIDTDPDDLYPVDEASKLLGLGPRELWSVLKTRGHVYNRKAYGKKAVWVPNERYRRAGYLTYRDTPYVDPDGVEHDGSKVYLTKKGLEWYRAGLVREGRITPVIQSALPLPRHAERAS